MVEGFDLSHWDGTPEWPLVPDKYKFVFIKATEGGYIADHLADQHYVGAKGRLRGCYHFWRYAASPQSQTTEFISRIRWLEAQGGKMELPPVLDLEDTRAPKDSLRIQTHFKICSQMLEAAFGRKPIVYTAKWYTDEYIGDCSWLKDYPLWVADYTSAPPREPNRLPRGLSRWLFWQYTDQAEIPGVAENDEDVDVFNGTEGELYRFAGMTPPISLEEKVDKLWAAHPELHGG